MIEPQLLEQRRELARHVIPLDALGLADDARALVLGKRAAEVAEQPRAELLRLADVHDLAVGSEHAIDAGRSVALRAHVRAHDGDLRVRRRRTEEVYL